VVAFGGKLFGLDPTDDNPTKLTAEFEVVDADRLRITRCSGFDAPGEFLRYERDATGTPQRVICGGVSLYPESIFRERYASESHWQPPAFK